MKRVQETRGKKNLRNCQPLGEDLKYTVGRGEYTRVEKTQIWEMRMEPLEERKREKRSEKNDPGDAKNSKEFSDIVGLNLKNLLLPTSLIKIVKLYRNHHLLDEQKKYYIS